MGNLGSTLNMLRKFTQEAVISSNPEDLEKADKIILPGVGSFDHGIKNLKEKGFIPVLNKRVLQDKVICLGICLGMQLLSQKSEEGELPGLGWIQAQTIRFRPSPEKLKIPHMGWNSVVVLREKGLLSQMVPETRFYFVHSYHVQCENEEDILCKTHYGYDFPSAIQRENIYGTQFHPEKSHKFGIRLLKNFVENI
jgi:glutamine amidotransferase